MSVIFAWDRRELASLLESCERDEALPLITKHLRPGARVMEAGCGAGRWVRYLADRGYRVVGLEYSGETLHMVRETWPDLCLVEGDAAHAPFAEGAFDAVLSFGLVEHWQDGPEEPLRETRRLLRPGGLAIISVPCLSGVRRLKRTLWWDEITRAPRAAVASLVRREPRPMTRLTRSYRYAVHPTYGRFFEYRLTPREFLEQVRAAGFDILEHVPLGSMDGVFHELNPLGVLVRFHRWRFHPTAIASWLDRRLAKHPFLHPHMQAVVAVRPSS